MGSAAPDAPRIVGPLLALGAHEIDTVAGAFRLHELRNLHTQRSVFALLCGDVSGASPLLARVHSSCVTSEFLGACDCDCASQLDAALVQIAQAGRGALFHLPQEGRGAGLAAKVRDRMIVQASRNRVTTFEAYERMGLPHDLRRYDEVRAACRLLGVDAPLRLLTNNPDKAAALEREKVPVAGLQPLEREASPFNSHYLSAKRRSGHRLAVSSPAAMLPPEPVHERAPTRLRSRPGLLHVAAYQLPVAAALPVLPALRAGARREAEAPPSVLWMQLHLYLDLASGTELMVLERRAAGGDGRPLCVRLQPAPLLERFALRRAPGRAAWAAFVAALGEGPGGCAVVAQARSQGTAGSGPLGRVQIELLAHHAGAGRVRVAAAPWEGGSARALERALGDRGLALGPRLRLPLPGVALPRAAREHRTGRAPALRGRA